MMLWEDWAPQDGGICCDPPLSRRWDSFSDSQHLYGMQYGTVKKGVGVENPNQIRITYDSIIGKHQGYGVI